MKKTDILRFKSADIKNYIDDIAELRLNAFKEFPYLYSGTLELERESLQIYISHPETLLIAAINQDQIVAVITGNPLLLDNPVLEQIADKLNQQENTASDYYYLGEGIILPAYRQPQFSYALYKKFIEEVKKMGYPKLTLATVIRPKDHPLRPPIYKSVESLLKYIKFIDTGIVFDMPWPTILANGKVETIDNSLRIWEKEI